MRTKDLMKLGLVLTLICGNLLFATVLTNPADTTTKSNWRTMAALEGDGQYGTDGYVIYGLNAPDNDYVEVYNASSLSAVAGDSAIVKPAYISDILFAGATGRWSGNGNFGQIEDPAHGNALTSTSMIGSGPVDPYVFTLTRAASQGFRLTIIYSCGDGVKPTWTAIVNDGSGDVTNTVTALESSSSVYHVFDISAGSDPITVSISADNVNGWITGFAFDPFGATSASNPGPADDPQGTRTEMEVDNVILSWDTGLDGQLVNTSIRKHYLYTNFANPNDPNLYFVAAIDAGTPTLPQASYGPLQLQRDQKYQWRVEEGLDNGQGGVYSQGDPNNVMGPVWTFYSALSILDLAPALPADLILKEGENAVFSVQATNPFTGDAQGLSYQWYKDNMIFSGETSETLMLSGVQAADEGQYWCEVTITASGTTAVSRTAVLSLKKVIGHWPLDGDSNDVSGNGYNGTAFGGVGYADGVVGTKALDCNGADAYLNCGNVPVTDSGAMSIAFWVKPRNINGDWKGILAKWGDTNTFWIGQHEVDGALNYSIYVPADTKISPENVLANNQWTHFVCTYDGHFQQIYVNGLLRVKSMDLNAPLSVHDGDLMIGQVPAGGNWFNGLIDDVRIYNYAFAPEEAADLYVTVHGPICVVEYLADISGQDGEPDCKVDFYDFAKVAEQWLECGIYPTCITEIP